MAIINIFKSLVSLSTLNTSIALVTIALEQVFNNVVFKCPCVTGINFIYGIMFLVVPAIVLLVLGFVLNPKTWIFFTGCCKRTRARNARECWRRFQVCCCGSCGCCGCCGCCKRARPTGECCFWAIFFRALVAPLSWISIGLLDGEYYACAVTKRPCDVNRDTGVNIYSAEYHEQIVVSCLIGWITVAGSFIIGALVYTCYRCCLNLDYWPYENSKWKETIREDVFQKLVKEEIEERAKDELGKCLEDKKSETIFKFFDKPMTDEEYKKMKTDKEKKNPEEMKTDEKKNNPEQVETMPGASAPAEGC